MHDNFKEVRMGSERFISDLRFFKDPYTYVYTNPKPSVMKKILVPTDFSEEAENAAEVAAFLAKKNGAEIYLLHVMEIPTYESNYVFQTYQDIPEGLFLMKQAKQRFQEFLKKPFFKGVRVIEAIQFERTYENIVKQAKEKEIDLIVMGSHGASGFKEMFVGSNTERVVRLASCPVFTVKHKMSEKEIDDVVFASDFSSEVYNAFVKIQQVVELFEAKLHILKVNTPNAFQSSKDSKEQMEDFAKYFELSDYEIHIYNDESVEQGILNFADEIDADLVSLATHGRKGLSHLINGSLAEDVANHSTRPVLSMRIKKD